MRYQFIEQYKDEFPVVVMCQVLEVFETGYYAWLKRPTCQHQREDVHIKQEIQEIFVLHKGRYGSSRIHRDLRDQGRCISRKRVARLTQEGELSARPKRRRVLTTKSDLTHPVAPNLLHREFTASDPNTKWVTDIPSIPTAQGWLYVAVILDLYSRIVVGWGVLEQR